MSSFAIRELLPEELDIVKPLLERSRSGPYRMLRHKIGAALDAHWFEQISSLAGQEDATVFAGTLEGRLVALAISRDLPWDSRIYGRSMGALEHVAFLPCVVDDEPDALRQLLEHACDRAAGQGRDFLLCRSYADDAPLIHALERAGFSLVDSLLDFAFDARRRPLSGIRRPEPAPGTTIRRATRDDLTELLQVARAAFAGHFGRYHADERTPPALATRIYQEWMRSAVDGYADFIFLAEVEGRIAGYSVWKEPSELERTLPLQVAHYSIAGVHPDFVGRGLFKQLTHAGMRELDGLADWILGPTHVNNHPVQKGYASLGWQIGDARHAFHRWLGPA